MRIVSVFVAGAALLSASVASAGDYHYGASLNCNECHVMHGAVQHGYNADGTGTYTPIGGAAPYENLLRNTVNTLCLSCHDNQAFAPDVLEANGGTAPALGRQAGALNMHNSGSYRDADGHTLGSTATAPGGAWSNADGLNCTDCHTPHGSGSAHTANPYRNLEGPAASEISYAVATNDLTKDVFERSNGGANHYDIGNVDFNEPKSDSSYFGAFCKQCHTNLHGKSSDPNMKGAGEWLRHPTADANIEPGEGMLDQFKNRLYRVKVMSASGDWGTQGAAWGAATSTLTPSCFSCHKGHGNQRAFGLINPDGAGTSPIGEEGSGTAYRDLCQSCHVEGS